MSQRTLPPGKIDRAHVTLSTGTERLYWSARLAADETAIRDAIALAGDDPAAVTNWLAVERRCRLQPDLKRQP